MSVFCRKQGSWYFWSQFFSDIIFWWASIQWSTFWWCREGYTKALPPLGAGVSALQCMQGDNGGFLKQWTLVLCTKGNPAHSGGQYLNPLPSFCPTDLTDGGRMLPKKTFPVKPLVMGNQGIVRQSQEVRNMRNWDTRLCSLILFWDQNIQFRSLPDLLGSGGRVSSIYLLM